MPASSSSGVETNYLVARISAALATDDRTHALDVRVSLNGGTVFLLGQVASEQRRLLVEAVAREVLPPDTSLVNEVCVQTFNEPTEPEMLG